MSDSLRNMTSVYLLSGDKILLLYRQGSRVVNDVWIGSAGGHFEKDELNDPEACVLRELKEELDIDKDEIENMELRYVTLRKTKGEIRQNYYYFANLKGSFDKDLSSNEGTCKWFSLDEVSDLEMPYTAKYVVDHYVSQGRNTQDLYVGVADGNEVRFISMPDK